MYKMHKRKNYENICSFVLKFSHCFFMRADADAVPSQVENNSERD